MDEQAFPNVWDAIEDTPALAANLRARSTLVFALQSQVSGWGVSQTAAARRLGVTQPRLSDLMHGHVDRFSLDALVNLVSAAGLALKLEVEAA